MSHPSIRSHRSSSRKTAGVRVIPLKLFVGYADLHAARTATATVADAVRRSGRRVAVEPLLWRFQQLATSHWRDRAIAAAQEADIVVLASSCPSAFTTGVEAWVNAFLNAHCGRRATIVAILGPADAWTITLEQTAAARTKDSAKTVHEAAVA